MSEGRKQRVVGCIPARWSSTRFPGKPLATILGKSLIQRTYENALRSDVLDALVVATDDERIRKHVEGFGGVVVMTSTGCRNGTERLAEALGKSAVLASADIVVNVQGDEPCVSPEAIEGMVSRLVEDEAAVMSTVVVPLRDEKLARDSSVVKCVVDRSGAALYFSRALIPGNKLGVWNANVPCYQHLGLYAYRREFLLEYAALPATPLQESEDLEQLGALEHGYRIAVAVVEGVGVGVDTPEDLERLEKVLCKESISS